MSNTKNEPSDDEASASCDCAIIKHGKKFVIRLAKRQSGSCPIRSFLAEQLDDIQKGKLDGLLTRSAESGPPTNGQKSKKLTDILWEFKSDQVRVAYFYARKPRNTILLAHGIIKKKADWPPSDIKTAEAIRREHEAIHEK